MNTVVRGPDRPGAEPLLLIHGLGSRWQVWSPVLDTLAAQFEVHALDLPGFGSSPQADGPATVPALVGHVREYLAANGIDRPHVAGNSMGAGIALELGRSGDARSVTAFSPIGFWNTPERLWCQGALRTVRGISRHARPAVPALARNPLTRAALLGLCYAKPAALAVQDILDDVDALAGATGFAEAVDSFGRYRPTEAGHLATIPTTIAWGNRDALLPYPTQHRRARALLPTAKHVTLPGCGHIPFSDNPELCARTVRATAAATCVS